MASTNEGPGEREASGSGGENPYAETMEAARRGIDHASGVISTAAHSGQDALAREAEARPVTLFLAALAAGFILGRVL